jgi:hypothetical protein
MSFRQDFDFTVSTQLAAMRRLQNGVPSGLPAQLEEVGTIVSGFETQLDALRNDDGYSQAGRTRQVAAAYDKAQVAVEEWRVARTNGVDKQLAGLRTALLTQANQNIPTPTDLQVQNMITRLADFDPLEVEMLYSNATDAERRVIEAAATAVGRQPVRRDDRVIWEPLLSTDRMSEAIATRAERANPDGAAQLRDLQQVRSAYEAVAAAAKQILQTAFPSHNEARPLAV